MPQPISRLRCVDRVAAIRSRCAGRSVLHVGCTNFPNTAAKIASRTLLHAQVASVASVLHGIDIDEPGLELLRQAGHTAVFRIDAKRLAEPHPALLPAYDVVLLADVIEHVEDPGDVLLGARSRLRPGGELVLSTVNAFYFYGMLRVMLGAEVSHPEHVASYTQSNLRELFARTGFTVRELRGVYEPFEHRGPPVRALKRIESAILALFPGISAGILSVAVPDEAAA